MATEGRAGFLSHFVTWSSVSISPDTTSLAFTPCPPQEGTLADPSSPSERDAPTRVSLALAFAKISLVSVGGSTNAWCRQVFVKEKAWLTDEEFGQAQAICQVLPGPNALNMAAYLGFQFHGLVGTLLSLLGLTLFPFCLVMVLGTLYLKAGSRPLVTALFTGLGAGAAGVSASNALDFSRKYRKDWFFLVGAVFVYVGLAVAHLHILVVVALTVAASLLRHWWAGR